MDEIQKLYDLYSRDLYRYIFSLTGDHYKTEDIVQATFVSAIKSIKTFKNLSSVKTWLIGIAKNEYRAYVRKNPITEPLANIHGGVNSSHDDILSVIEEIKKLPETQRQIIILRLINDLTFTEIAQITGKTENYCRVSFFRTKRKIVEVLNNGL